MKVVVYNGKGSFDFMFETVVVTADELVTVGRYVRCLQRVYHAPMKMILYATENAWAYVKSPGCDLRAAFYEVMLDDREISDLVKDALKVQRKIDSTRPCKLHR